MEKTVRIQVNQVELVASIHEPEIVASQTWSAPASAPIVIICHGFIGTRIGVDRLFVEAARDLAENGTKVVRFDYAGCGESTGTYGEQRFEDLVEQTKRVIDYVATRENPLDQPIVLLGHSLGGAVAVHTASTEPRVHSLVLWAPVAHPYRDIARIVGERNAVAVLQHGEPTQYQGYLLANPYFSSLERATPLHAAQEYAGNVFLAHGSGDDVIPSRYCFTYNNVFALRQQGTCEKEVIIGADHTFSNYYHRKMLITVTKRWLQKQYGWTPDYPQEDFQI